MYDPTCQEKRHEHDLLHRSCKNCGDTFTTTRKDNEVLCSMACSKEVAEYGYPEYPCSDFDAENNM